jgi:hypothetical protein
MSLCSNGLKPTIEWQYAGEDKQRILGADNYSLETMKGKCPVPYHVFGQYISLNDPYCGYRAYWRTASAVIGSSVLSYIPQKVLSSQEWVLPLSAGNAMSIRPISFELYFAKNLANSIGQIFDNPGGCINTSSPAYGRRLDLASIDIIRVDGQPDNCGDCVFKVTKNNVVVYQKATPVCPTVTHTCGEQCPPGTCQCDCGSVVCCYDTVTGKAVKSFRK